MAPTVALLSRRLKRRSQMILAVAFESPFPPDNFSHSDNELPRSRRQVQSQQLARRGAPQSESSLIMDKPSLIGDDRTRVNGVKL